MYHGKGYERQGNPLMMREYGKEELYVAVKDIIDRDEFEERIAGEIENYGGLIDDNTAAMVVVDKLRSDFFNVARISEIKPSDEVTLYARVDFLGKIRSFDGGKVVNTVISDNTGSCILVLWDNDVELVKNGKIEEGKVIKIINGYAKEGYYGTEVNIGRWGLVKTETEGIPEIGKEKKIEKLNDAKKGIVNIEARIKEIHSTRIFFTENGERFAASILAEDESGERKVVLWDEMARLIQKFREGDMIRIDRAYVKNGEIHAGDISTISPEK